MPPCGGTPTSNAAAFLRPTVPRGLVARATPATMLGATAFATPQARLKASQEEEGDEEGEVEEGEEEGGEEEGKGALQIKTTTV